MASAVMVYVVFVFWLAHWGMTSGLPEEAFLQFVREKEILVNRLADEAASIFRRRGKLASQCDCSVHVCRTQVSRSACTVFRQLGFSCGIRKCTTSRSDGPVSFVQTPPDQDVDSIAPEMKGNICLYKAMEPLLMDLDPEPPTTTRISIRDGHSRIYPGASFRKKMAEPRDERRGECPTMDPRRTPEYVGASVGPKDVVFIIDSSQNMATPWTAKSNVSRLDSVNKAIQSLLDTFSSMDRVNVVAVSDKARRRGTGQHLFPGTPSHLHLIQQSINSLHPLGRGNIRSGIRLGFKLLIDSNDKRKKRREFHRGQKVLLVISGSNDGRRNVSRFLRSVDRLQNRLEKISGTKARIFTFSIGKDLDDALPKQIACANDGAWFSIGPRDDPFEVLHSYNTFLHTTYRSSHPIWTNFKWDRHEGQRVTTVAKAFYFQPGGGKSALLLGVVSHAVRLDDLKVGGARTEDIAKKLRERSRKHNAIESNVCQLQVFRNVFADGSICVDRLPLQRTKKKSKKSKKSRKRRKRRDAPCFEYEGRYYKASLEEVSWEEAVVACRLKEAALTQVESRDVQAFLAGMASPDGTWIAARATKRGDGFRWLRELEPTISLSGIRIADGVNASNLRLSIDNRGATGNLKPALSERRIPYICVYKSKEHCDRGVKAFPKRGYFAIPPLDLCIEEEESLADVAFLSSSFTLFPSSHLWCSLDHGRRDFRSLCCQKCPDGFRPIDEALPCLNAEELNSTIDDF